ncbi:MAG: cytochrome c peroxidase [Bryobacteraceae bacterium]
MILLLTPIAVLAQRGGGGPGGGGPGGGGAGQNPPLASLKTVTPPKPTGLDRYVQDEVALVALGKVFFWDMQAGSDGRTACATCHFHAGADHRSQNQLSGADAVANQSLTAADFPFRKLTNPGNNRSAVASDKRQVAGSMGVVMREFVDVEPGSGTDLSRDVAFASPFLPNGIHVRQVTGRNSPSVINAVFNVRNFWDGRASNIFTGSTPFGDSDTGLRAAVVRNGKLEREAVRIDNASLASQAVGPALSSVEMSWAGRGWPALGRKLLNLAPLARQKVSPDDSVLGVMANAGGNGLRSEFSYAALIQAAFRPEYVNSTELLDGYSQAEQNFALFWGLAIQAYESTLVANDSRVDQFLEGRTAALTALEQQGLNEFRNGGSQCINCHNGAETTAAGWSVVQRRATLATTPANLGFFRIGVSPITEDIGFGGKDDFGSPLFNLATPNAAGTFKAPSLRNVEFTGPYFHNGGQATLEQVLDFYARNGDFPDGGNLGPGIGNIRLTQAERTSIVAFLKALSDDRVRFQRAPFDHPSLCVPNGHVESAPGQLALDPEQAGSVAADKWALVPEVGKDGLSVPLQTFDELLRGAGNDGSRANTMTAACKP